MQSEQLVPVDSSWLCRYAIEEAVRIHEVAPDASGEDPGRQAANAT